MKIIDNKQEEPLKTKFVYGDSHRRIDVIFAPLICSIRTSTTIAKLDCYSVFLANPKFSFKVRHPEGCFFFVASKNQYVIQCFYHEAFDYKNFG